MGTQLHFQPGSSFPGSSGMHRMLLGAWEFTAHVRTRSASPDIGKITSAQAGWALRVDKHSLLGLQKLTPACITLGR